MVISTNSWHYRWYTYWLAQGRGISERYQENLCHYVRVLLFWAPMTWLDQHTSWDWGKLSQRTLSVFLVFALLGTVSLYVVVAAVTQTTKFLMAIGSLGGLLAVIGLLILSVKTMQGKRLEVPGTVKLAVGYAVAKKRRICPFLTFGG